MKKIDIASWDRRVPYENFIGYTNPVFSLSTRLDVTRLRQRCIEKKTSFFTDFLYIVMVCLNSIEQFRLRILDGEVVLYDSVRPSYIVMSDNNVIKTCRSEMCYDYGKFYSNVRRDMEAAKNSDVEKFNVGRENDFFFISCMPWVDLHSVSNPYDLKNAESSSIPRLTWGKFVEENGRYKMMMDIAVHHALIDGEPVCRAFNKIQDALDDTEAFFGGNNKRGT